ncbi:MAG: type IV pilus twitching motility protein PilT [Myxococcales bacterium]|nr:type IV pilus twitching motility protein PilT [Myxococcales bacterium]
MRINDLISRAMELKASDIHVSSGEVPAFRVDGEIIRMSGEAPLGSDDAKRLAYSMMQERQRTAFENVLETDFAISFKGIARFRVNVYTQSRGIGFVMRQIPSKVLTLEQLGLGPVFQRIASFKRGLVLVTGPTGSGKSTTLAAMIDFINKNRREHILTIEDPVEFVHVPDKCIINQREIGADTQSFAAALRSALREDPDVILVGELRDLETISLAISAAETGHLVFGTLHTNSAPETVDRLIDAFPYEQQSQIRTMLSSSLQAVVSQVLLKKAFEPGRIACQEIMLCNPAIRNLIRESKLFQIPSMMQAGKGEGQQLMEMAAKDLALRRKITKDQAIGLTNNPKMFDEIGPVGAARLPMAPGTPR